MINLLPPQHKEELLQEEHWKVVLILGIVILAFLICLTLIIFSIKIYISGQISAEKILLELEEKKFKTTETQELEEEIGLLNQKLLKLKSFYQKQSNFAGILEKISNTLPSGTYLTNLSFNPLIVDEKEKYLAQVSLSGFSPTRGVLIEFKRNLEQIEQFGEVNFPPSSWVQLTDIDFSVVFKVK